METRIALTHSSIKYETNNNYNYCICKFYVHAYNGSLQILTKD